MTGGYDGVGCSDFLNNRYHHPKLATFISVDPLVAETGHPYDYANNNPVTHSDSSGLCVGPVEFGGWGNNAEQEYQATVRNIIFNDLCNGPGTMAERIQRYQAWIAFTSNTHSPVPGAAADFAIGATWGFVKDTVEGVGQVLANPIESAKNTVHVVTNPIETGVNTLEDCTSGASEAGSCATGLALGGGWLKRLFKRHTPKAPDLCSFSAETEVLMADATVKPISQVRAGDWVIAQDMGTGERGPRQVAHVWSHDDIMVELSIDGATVTTTEDHRFWNDTDGEYQRADMLDNGDLVLTADGDRIPVDGLVDGSETLDVAYNLEVDEIHTYFVTTGDEQVLVHNDCHRRALRRALGNPPFPDAEAHHLVPLNGDLSKPARVILQKYNIGINSAENGVYLRQVSHYATYGNTYRRYVNVLMSEADEVGGEAGVRAALASLADELAATNDWAWMAAP